MKQIQILKSRIREKFGTVRRFAELSGIPETQLRYLLSGKMEVKKADNLMSEIKSKLNLKPKPDPRYLGPEVRESIRRRIVVEYRSVRRFCNQYPEFTPVLISNIITGRKKRNDEKIDRIISVLN